MIKLGDTTNLTADEASSALAKFANITQMPQEQFERLGSTIVALGNSLATTEADIVAMGTRIASAGSQAGMSEAQIMSFAGALSSVGISAEAGGTAFSKFTNELTLAVQTGSGKLSQFAQVAGMSAEQFKKAYEQDAANAIAKFIEGLANAEKQGKSAVQIIEELGIKDSSLKDTLLRAAGASDVFTQALQTGTKAFEENTALSAEADKKYQTLESKILKNKFTELAVEIGNALTPYINQAIDLIGNLTDTIKDLDENQIDALVKFGVALAGIGPALKAISGCMGAIKVLKELKALMTGGAIVAGAGGAVAGVGGMAAMGPAGLGCMGAIKVLKELKALMTGGAIVAGAGGAVAGVGGMAAMGPAGLALGATALGTGLIAVLVSNKEKIATWLQEDKIQQWIQSQGQGISEFFKGLPEKVTGFIEKGTEAASQFADNVSQSVSDGMQRAKDAASNKVSEIKESVSNGFNNAKDAVKNKMSEMVNTTQQKFNEMVNKAKEMPAKFKSEATKMGQGLIDGVKSKANAAKQAVTNTANNMLNAAKEKVSNWASIGRSMIEGLINGIKSKVSAAVNAAKNAVSSAYNAAKDFLNINSPSRKFIALGEATTEGLAVGIARTSDRPVQEVRKITQKMQAEMDAFLKKNQSLVNDTNSVLGSITTALSNKYQQMYDKEMNSVACK